MNTNQTQTRLSTMATWAIQFFGTLALVLLSYWWLLWADSRSWQVVGSIATAVILIIIALWLECATLDFFAESQTSAVVAFRRTLCRIPPFAVWLLVFVALLWGLHELANSVPRLGVRIAQMTSARPRTATRTLLIIVAICQWVIVPAVLLPVAAAIAQHGFGGWRPKRVRAALRSLRSGWYWIALVLAVAIGAYVPWKLVRWIPEPSTLKHEAWSLGLRFSAAYFLLISAWVGFCWVLGTRSHGTAPATAGDASPGR